MDGVDWFRHSDAFPPRVFSMQVLEEVRNEAGVTEVLVFSDGTLRPIRPGIQRSDAMDESDTLEGAVVSETAGGSVDVVDLSDVEIEEGVWEEKPPRVEGGVVASAEVSQQQHVERQVSLVDVEASEQEQRQRRLECAVAQHRFVRREEEERNQRMAQLRTQNQMLRQLQRQQKEQHQREAEHLERRFWRLENEALQEASMQGSVGPQGLPPDPPMWSRHMAQQQPPQFFGETSRRSVEPPHQQRNTFIENPLSHFLTRAAVLDASVSPLVDLSRTSHLSQDAAQNGDSNAMQGASDWFQDLM